MACYYGFQLCQGRIILGAGHLWINSVNNTVYKDNTSTEMKDLIMRTITPSAFRLIIRQAIVRIGNSLGFV